MKPSQVIPGAPNSQFCISFGCYDGTLLHAYGSGTSIVIAQTHTFMVQQIIQENTSDVTSVGWARTGGRLAAGSLNSISIYIPQPISPVKWECKINLKPEGIPKSLSWSFFGDTLLSVSEKLCVWNFEVEKTGDLQFNDKPLWSIKSQFEYGSISPDGRLIATCREDSRVFIFYREGHLNEETQFPQLNSDALRSLKLNNNTPVSWFDWKDISVFKLYLNYYNPNALLTINQDGWVRIWSEYTSPEGIGFNIVFQIRTNNGLASWLRDFKSMENNISQLAQKQEFLRQGQGDVQFTMNARSCILRARKSEPEQPIFGAMMKDRIPVEWFVIAEGTKVVYYMCEGLGAFPVTAINIKSHLQFSNHWSTEASRWIPSQLPFFVIKEFEEIQVISLDVTGDFVRWRKRYGGQEYGGYSSALTGVSGGHRGDIVQVVPHGTLPLVSTLDSTGMVRIWSTHMGVKQDPRAVDQLRHWGVLEQSSYTFVKWIQKYALLICGDKTGKLNLYKWMSDTANKLKLPSMHWSIVHSWQGMEGVCVKINTSSIENAESGIRFLVSAIFKNKGYQVWSVGYEHGIVSALIDAKEDNFYDTHLNSIKIYNDDYDQTYMHYIYSLTKTKLSCSVIETNGTRIMWEKNLVADEYSMKVSKIIMLVSPKSQSLSFYTLEGNQIGKFTIPQSGQFLTNFLSKGLITENIVIVFKSLIQVLAQEFLHTVGEQEMPWRYIVENALDSESTCLGVSSFQHILLGVKRILNIYTHNHIQQELAKYQIPKPYYHPLTLFELMRGNHTKIIEMLFKTIETRIEEGKMCYTLDLRLDDFFKIQEEKAQAPAPAPAASSNFDWFFEAQPSAPVASQPAPTSQFSESDAKRLKEKLQETAIELPGLSGDVLLLMQLFTAIDSYSLLQSQSRTMDDFVKVFYLNVRIFKFYNEQKKPMKSKPQCLSTMDIAWVLHSDQQDTLFQVLFTGEMDWAQMRMYGMGIWVKSLYRIKSMIETIARNEFRVNKDPKAVTLWYLALGKKSILLNLYKQDAENKRIYTFLVNDFTQKDWQVKAQKNAFELRKQRKYEMSASFFLLGGQLLNAIEVLAQDLGDPQMAMAVAKLQEGENGPIYNQLVDRYLLKTGLQVKDPWLVSIGFSLLNMHAESLESLSSMPNEPLQANNVDFWTEKTQPTLSGFHPSLTYYFKLLKDSIKVKRDCDTKGIQLSKYDNIEKEMAGRCAKAYLRAGLPILALKMLKDHENVDINLLDDILKEYLLMIINDTAENEWLEKFPTLLSEISYLSSTFSFSQKSLLDFVSALFYNRDMRHYQCSLLAGVSMLEKAAESVLHRAAIVHIILSRYSRDPFFLCKVETLTDVANELIKCLIILRDHSIEFSSLSLNRRGHLFHITFSVFLSQLMIGYTRGQWESVVGVLRGLDEYLNDQNKETHTEIVIPENQAEHSNKLLSCWIRYLLVNKLHDLVISFNCKEYDEWMDKSLLRFNLLDVNSNKAETPEKLIEKMMAPGRGIKKRSLMPVSRLVRRIFSWKIRLLSRAQKLISSETLKSIQTLIEMLVNTPPNIPTDLGQHFSDTAAYLAFNDFVGGKTQIHLLLQHSNQGISTFVHENHSNPEESENIQYDETLKENANLFKSGIDLFRSKESVLGFSINKCDNKNISIILNSKRDRIREINLDHALKFKKRNAELEIEVEDPETWQECLHQYDTFIGPEEYMYNPAINSALSMLNSSHSKVFIEEMQLPPPVWHRSSLNHLLTSLSSHKTRQEKVNQIVGHPLLPLYVTGNDSGMMTLWQYTRSDSLQDFATISTTSKITWMSFNGYGDKLGACDASGNFFLYKFDLQPTSFQPQLTMMNSAGSKASAFSFLNLGSVIATIGYKPRGFLSIYDTLLPPNQSCLHTENIGGTTVHYISRYQQLIIGTKKGKLARYDLRMQKVVDSIESKHDSIKSIASDPTETTFVTGGREGVVKIWDSRNLTLKETIEVSKKSKGGITKLEFLENALFASSGEGVLKLLRTTTH